MPIKRKSRGRHKGKGSKGRTELVACHNCRKLVPIDKAVKRVVWRPTVGGEILKELRAQGAYIPRKRDVVYYCINCAVYLGIIKVRARDERKQLPPELLEKRLPKI